MSSLPIPRLAAVLLACVGVTFAQSPHDDDPLVITRAAMAVKFQIAIVGARPADHAVALAAFDEVDAIESRINVWSPTSAISAWNESGHTELVDVPRDVAHLVAAAQEMSRRTQGAFDITVGPLFELWGLTQREPTSPTERELTDTKACVGNDLLRVQLDPPQLGREQACVRVDLSAAAKGYAVSRIVARLRDAGIDNAFIAAGSSTVYALGRGPDGRGWPFEVSPGTTWRLVDEAVSTSGHSSTDLELADGAVRRHILDPRRAEPATRHVAQAVFRGPDPLEADMASTSLIVLGVVDGRVWAKREAWDRSRRSTLLTLVDGRSVELGALIAAGASTER